MSKKKEITTGQEFKDTLELIFKYKVNMKSTKSNLNIVELHGRDEIEQFFRNDFSLNEQTVDEEYLQKVVNYMLTHPNGTEVGLPSKYKTDGTWVILKRKAEAVRIYHN
jgi:hypothetical protein